MGSRVYKMAIALSGKVDGSLNSSLSSTGTALSGLQNRLKTLDAAQQKLGQYKGLKNTISETSLEYRRAQSETAALARSIQATDKPSKTMQRQFAEAQKRSAALRTKLMAQSTQLRGLRGEMDKAGVSVNRLGKFEGDLATQAARATKAQQGLMKAQSRVNAARDRLRWQNVQGEILASGAIVMALRQPLKDAMELETAMAEIRKVVDFDTPEAFKEMGTDLQKLSLKIPMTVKQLGEIYASGGQSGIAQKDLLAFTESAAKMGVAYNTTADQAGEWMAKWRTAFQMSQDEVVVLADQINYLGNNTAATASQISAVVSRIGPLGAVGNVAAKEIAALGASIVGAGQTEKVASTGIKNFMLSLTAGASASKAQREAWSQLNIDPEIMAKEMMKNPEKVMVGVLERIGKIDKSQQASLMTQLFGRETVGAIAPLITNLDNLRRNFALTKGEDFSGSMEKEFQSLADTGENALQLIQNAARVGSQQFGKAFIPSIKSASKVFIGLSTKILQVSEANPAFFNAMVKGIGLLGVIKVSSTVFSLLGTLASFPFLSVYAGIMKLSAAYIASNGSLLKMLASTKVGIVVTKAWAAAQWLLNAAMSANPIGLLVIGITALVAILVIAYKKFEKFRNVVDGAWSSIKNFFGFGGKTNVPAVDSMPVAMHAAGGHFFKPHMGMVAEAGKPESIIPHTPSGEKIWQETGRMAGFSDGGGSPISISLQVTAGAGADGNSIGREIVRVLENELPKAMRKMKQQEVRLSF